MSNTKTRTVKTAVQKAKDKTAKNKVDELLADVGVTSKKKQVKATAKTAETKKNTKWLEDENDRLTKVNVDWENKFIEVEGNYKRAYAELQTLKAKSGSMPESDMKKRIVEHFRDLENAHLGRNPERMVYKTTTPVAQLDKMVERFPFLKEIVTKN